MDERDVKILILRREMLLLEREHFGVWMLEQPTAPGSNTEPSLERQRLEQEILGRRQELDQLTAITKESTDERA